ncbi:hypothetical protein IKD82_02565 [Candidatus Saccharibacteria bacterium]|nr:hypothetical protein [Candidatus Saccharibacteria bacterium]
MESNNNPVPPETPTSKTITPDVPLSSTPPINLSKPAKSSKPLIWCLAILATIGIVAAAVFAYLYFTTPTSPIPNDNQSSTTSEEPTTTEETEITDTYIIRDLSEKTDILHNFASSETTKVIKRYAIQYGYALPLYRDGTLNENAKLTYIINSINSNDQFSAEELQSIINEQGYDERAAEDFRMYNNKKILADAVEAKYFDVFGERLIKGAINNQQHSCPEYYYNSEYDFYYISSSGCGGTGPYDATFYKNKYTINGDQAYVYMSAGVFNKEDDKVYCDVIKDDNSLPAVCGENINYDTFTIDESNYQKFAQYRFVFNKAEDGTYYFSKVEKL